MQKPRAIIVSKEGRLRDIAKNTIEYISKEIGIEFETSKYKKRVLKSKKIQNAQLYITSSLDPSSSEQRIGRELKDTGCARVLFTNVDKLIKEHVNHPKSSLFSGYLRHKHEEISIRDMPNYLLDFKTWFRMTHGSTFDDIIVEGDINPIEKEFQGAIERVRKARKMCQPLNVGIIGLGKLGRQIIHDLKSKPYIKSVHAFTNFAKDNYEELIIPRMAFEGDERRKFYFHESLEALLETSPNPLIICTGEWAELIKYGEYDKIQNLTEKLMNGAYPKVKDVLQTIKIYEDKGYDCLKCMESNSTGALLQVAKRIGLNPAMLTSITPDMSRHKTLLLHKLNEKDPTLQYSDIDLDVIGEHGKEIPLLKEAKIRGKYLSEVFPEFQNKDYRRAFINEARNIGLKLMTVAEGLGDNYGGTPDKIVEHLGDFAYMQRTIPSAYSYFEDEDCFIGSPSIINYPLRIKSAAKRLEDLSQDEEVIAELKETIEYQKALADKYHPNTTPS